MAQVLMYQLPTPTGYVARYGDIRCLCVVAIQEVPDNQYVVQLEGFSALLGPFETLTEAQDVADLWIERVNESG